MEYYAHSVKGKPQSSWQSTIDADPKPVPQLLEDHLKETADLASIFAGKINLASLGRLAGLLHDIGKYSEAFQNYLKSAKGKQDPDSEPAESEQIRDKVDHSSAGAQIVWESLNTRDDLSRLLAQVIALAIASHHTGLIDCLSPDGEDKYSNRILKNPEKTHIEEVRSKTVNHVTARFRELVDAPELLVEFRQCLKHTLSGEQSSEIREFYVSLLVRFLFSAIIDADRLSAAGRNMEITKNPKVVIWEALTERLEHHLTGIPRKNRVDDIRAEVSSACRGFAAHDKGLYRLTVPTGGGKTLSSLRFALHHAARHRMDRVIYVIPYISIIDQNAALGVCPSNSFSQA